MHFTDGWFEAHQASGRAENEILVTSFLWPERVARWSKWLNKVLQPQEFHIAVVRYITIVLAASPPQVDLAVNLLDYML